MKKLLLHVSVAVVLGVAIMLFPLWTYYAKYKEEGPIVMVPVKLGSAEPDSAQVSVPVIKPMYLSENWQNYTKASLETRGIPTYEDNSLPPPQSQLALRSTDESLQMLAVGFVAAMVVYLVVRRRVPRPTSTYRFPPL